MYSGLPSMLQAAFPDTLHGPPHFSTKTSHEHLLPHALQLFWLPNLLKDLSFPKNSGMHLRLQRYRHQNFVLPKNVRMPPLCCPQSVHLSNMEVHLPLSFRFYPPPKLDDSFHLIFWQHVSQNVLIRLIILISYLFS